MDNMVSNDQAYDSHTAEGFQLDNNVGYSQEMADTTRHVILNLNASDEIHVGVNNENDHTVINAGTSKLVKIKVLRQDDGSDAYEENTVFLTGWGWIIGDSTQQTEEAVSFGITFSARPIVVTGYVGRKVGSDPTHIGDTVSDNRVQITQAVAIATDGFTLTFFSEAGVTLANTVRNVYSWIAPGELN